MGSRCIDTDVFNGTAITSLTLPASINSYTYISDTAFRNMPFLQEIHFNGIKREDIQISEEKQVDANIGKVYTSLYSHYKKYGVFKSSNSNY